MLWGGHLLSALAYVRWEDTKINKSSFFIFISEPKPKPFSFQHQHVTIANCEQCMSFRAMALLPTFEHERDTESNIDVGVDVEEV